MGDLVAAFSSNNFIGKEAKKEACILVDATSCSAIFSIACHWFGSSEFQAKPFRGPGTCILPLKILPRSDWLKPPHVKLKGGPLTRDW